ncbi:MAG: efflux RND transporter periplasmic adaptor subunit, partial [Caulobacteraceae bacterium]|nr:efflux RND transporter periplasmic adaptor subunit [Caulobacteraceae bacterium]
GLKGAGIGLAVLAATIVVLGVAARLHQAHAVRAWTSQNEIPTVSVAPPQVSTEGQTLILPGSLSALYDAQIYARVSGYLRRWYVDIGARVRTGQPLADIDTPELDQQLAQARANLESLRANMRLAQLTARRWSGLLAQDAVSRQESDEKAGDFAVKSAQVAAGEAELNRLLSLKAFARITAPFDGVVTARRTDIGALINAEASATASSALFDVAKVDRLRLYVRVPQTFSARIQPGMAADFTVPEYPGQTFRGVLTNTAGAVSDASGTVLAEFAVDNARGALKAGDYAQVSLRLPGPSAGGVTTVPASAVIFRRSGQQVAVAGPDDRVVLRKVTTGRDLGSTVEIVSGLAPGDRVIDNPPDSIGEGDLVRVAAGRAR